MWECSNCKESIEDKYKHCWSCGTPKTEGQKVSSTVRIRLPSEEPPEEFRSANKVPPAEDVPLKEETPPENQHPHREEIPFGETFQFEEKSPSKVRKIVPLFLWLAAVALAAGFAYYSSQKTSAFENRVAEEARNLNAQTNQFVFSKDAPREKKGTVKAKVLPLNAKTKEVDSLYYSLPDDLRPANLEEVKTLLWLDCQPGEAGSYEDGSMAYRDKCNAYLVDRNTSKVVQVQDFSGELPPLKKQWGSRYASGKVLPEAYISYIKASQTETERAPFGYASDSPNHHLWFKSELLYSIILLVLLTAIGFGWAAYTIKSARWNPE
jgi:hypothetical protein